MNVQNITDERLSTVNDNLPALNTQLADQKSIEEIDRYLDYYQTLFTPQQWMFCVNLSLGATLKQSMEEAGYRTCTRANASRLLDMHNSRVNLCFQLMQKRNYMSSSVDKRWCIAKLIAVVEEAQERGELKTVVASVRELNLMSANHAPVNARVEQAVSVTYEFINLPGTQTPGIREVIATPEPKTNLINVIEHPPLSEAAVEFCTHKLPSGF